MISFEVNANCYYDDTNNILSFYLWWQQVQIRVLDDDHNVVIIDHHVNDNDYDLHVIHDIVRNNNDFVFTDDDDYNDVIVNHRASDSDCDVHVNNNTHIKNNNNVIYDNNNNLTYNNPFVYSTSMDNNDVPTDIYEFDTDCDCYNDHNNSINIITGNYDIYDEDHNNNVDYYDVGIAQDDDLVANDCEENNYSTSLVPCVLSSSGTTSIADDCDPVGANDHYMIRCYNTSFTISSISYLKSFTFPLTLSSLETSSSSNRDTCVGCNSQNGDDTDLDLVPVYLSSYYKYSSLACIIKFGTNVSLK